MRPVETVKCEINLFGWKRRRATQITSGNYKWELAEPAFELARLHRKSWETFLWKSLEIKELVEETSEDYGEI